MKHSVTRKAIKESFGTVIAVPYADLQFLLQYEDAFGYNHGVYGWNCDYYAFDNVCICTGYRPHGKKIPYDLTHKYNIAAKNIIDTNNDFYEKVKKIENLIDEFITEINKMNL